MSLVDPKVEALRLASTSAPADGRSYPGWTKDLGPILSRRSCGPELTLRQSLAALLPGNGSTSAFRSRCACGYIINMASLAALTGIAGVPDYSAAKGGILAFTTSVARELAHSKCPGT